MQIMQFSLKATGYVEKSEKCRNSKPLGGHGLNPKSSSQLIVVFLWIFVDLGSL